MGRVVSKSAQMNKSQNMIRYAREHQQNVFNVISSLESFASDCVLTGESYENAKGFISAIYLPITKTLYMALEDEIAADQQVIDCCNTYLKETDLFDEDTIVAEINRLQGEICKLQDSSKDLLPGVSAINQGRIGCHLSRIRELEKCLQELDSFDCATKNLHNSVHTRINTINQKIEAIFSPELYVNGRYDYSYIDMSWADQQVSRWEKAKAAIDARFGKFVLPEEQRKEIEEILNSKVSWEEKAELVRQVYERYLFDHVKDKDGKNAFLEFAKILKENDGLITDPNVIEVEEKLGIALKESGIDIRAVTRVMCDDFMRAMPRSADPYNKMKNYINLVNTGCPADLKSQELGKAVGIKESEEYDFGFSIWSREWEQIESGNKSEENTYKDFLGNYAFGYISAGYWEGLDFDHLTGDTLSSMLLYSAARIINPKITDMSTISYSTVKNIVRTVNPDKTDAEIFCRLGAGLAQIASDKDAKKYVESLLSGNWGDNTGDSDTIGIGFDDYYRTNGIDEKQLIRKDRTPW
jgi:hypothetical protein